MKSYIILLVLVLLLLPALASAAPVQYGDLVDMPTAGILARGAYDINLRMQPEGNLLLGVSIALLDRLNFGFSYGGNNIIGYGNAQWNPQPGFQIKYRIFEESYWAPGVALGFDSQGFGRYFEEANRYATKSRGFYAAASKNYKFLGRLAFHGGANYSIEQRRGPDNPVDVFVGLEKSLNPELTLIGEYDFGFNDDIRDQAFGEGRGYLNAGVKWLFNQKMLMEFDLKNLTRNGYGDQPTAKISRTVKIAYFDSF